VSLQNARVHPWRVAAVSVATTLALTSAPAARAQDASGQGRSTDDLAQEHFERGVELYDRSDYRGALESFRTSYGLYASPNSLLFAARALRQLGRRTEAADEFARAAREARERAEPRYEPSARAADAERAALLRVLGRVVLEVRGQWSRLHVRVGERELSAEAIGLPVVVEPGEVAIAAATDDGRSASRRARVRPGAEARVEIDLGAPRPRTTAAAGGRRGTGAPAARPRPSRPARPPGDERSAALSIAGWTSVAVGVTGWAGLIVFGLMADSEFDDLQARCGSGPCDPSLQGDVDRGRLYDTIANIGLVVGAIGTAAGVTLLAIDVASAPSKTSVGLRVTGAF